MAVTLVNAYNNYNEYVALSTDEWPTNVPANSLLLEIDSGDIYYWSGSTWTKFGEAPSNNAMGYIEVNPQPVTVDPEEPDEVIQE